MSNVQLEQSGRSSWHPHRQKPGCKEGQQPGAAEGHPGRCLNVREKRGSSSWPHGWWSHHCRGRPGRLISSRRRPVQISRQISRLVIIKQIVHSLKLYHTYTDTFLDDWVSNYLKCQNCSPLTECIASAEGDQKLREMLKNAPKNALMTSKTVQNDLIEAAAQFLREKIVSEVPLQAGLHQTFFTFSAPAKFRLRLQVWNMWLGFSLKNYGTTVF